jgi:hypothetical protein
MNYTDRDRLFLVESLEEMEETLKSCYVAFLRLYSSFKDRATHIWLSQDCDLEKQRDHIRGKCFLGIWPFGDNVRLYRQMRELCQRELIVRHEWIEKKIQEIYKDRDWCCALSDVEASLKNECLRTK